MILAAIADDPEGPFVKHNEPIFRVPGAHFAAEDPFIWYQKDADMYYAIVKDMKGELTGKGQSLAFYESNDGLDWRPSPSPFISKPIIHWENGSTESVKNLERPQVLLEDGRPSVLYCSAMQAGKLPFNVHIPLGPSTEWPVDGMIMNDANSLEIAIQAKKEKVKDLRQSGLTKVREGVTSLAELERVTKD